ncbi:MAG: S-layer homology domain-containing protein [Clostridia bacterium]|nr:S-layer homology domain-containing protein [Clostridia bacterium]
MNKKLLAGLLSVVIIFSAFNIIALAEGFREPVYESPNTSEYITAEELSILYECGVVPWKEIKDMEGLSEKIISREYAAWYICQLTGIDMNGTEGYETLFKDVSSQNEFYGQIKTVVSAGFMQGDPDGEFRPNAPITSMEAATVLLRVLGYDIYMKMAGMNKALINTEILSGIEIKDEITHGEMMRMILNALKSPALKHEYYAILKDQTVDIGYVLDDEYLGFQHILGLFYDTGVLDAIPETTLEEPGSTLRDGYIRINGVEYQYEGDPADFLGYKINFIYKSLSDKTRVIVYLFKSDKNEELVLSHKEIDGFSNDVYSYTDGNRSKHVSFPRDAKIIFNGLANPGYTSNPSEMSPKFGTVTFINNDNDQSYDVVKVESFSFYLSVSAVKGEEKLYCKDVSGNDTSISLKDTDYVVLDGGKKIALDRIKANQLLIVKESSNSTRGTKKVVIECQKPSRSNVGITAVYKDYVVGGANEFKIWDNIKNTLELNKIYTLYIVDDEVVLAVEADDEGLMHVYLIDYKSFKEEFEDATAKIAVVDTSRNYQIYDVAKKLYLDGDLVTNLQTPETTLVATAQNSINPSSTMTKAQPARIGFNRNGEVNKIDTYNVGANEEESIEPAKAYNPTSGNMENVTSFDYVFGPRSLYHSSWNIGGYKQVIGEIGGAEFICVPINDRANSDLYKSGMPGNVKSFALDIAGINDEDKSIDVVYYYYNDTTANAKEYFQSDNQCIITDLYQEIDSNGDVQNVIEAYKGNSKVRYTCESDLADQMRIGDVWCLDGNSEGHIKMYLKMFSPEEGFTAGGIQATMDSSSIADIYGSLLGTGLKLSNGRLLFSPVLPESVITLPDGSVDWKQMGTDWINISSATVFKYRTVNGQPKVEASAINELMTYDKEGIKASTVIINKTGTASQLYIIER